MKRLAELRKEKNLTQTALAMKLNMTQNMFSCYEKGKYQPSIEALKVFAKFFNVSVDYLIENSDVRHIAENDSDRTASERELLQIFRGLSHDEQQRALGMLKAIGYCK